MANKTSPSQRVSGQMQSELDSQTPRLVTRLQSEFAAPDRSNASTATYHAIIRQNWADPMWRQAEAIRVGPVPFVVQAMAAFNLDKSALSDHPAAGVAPTAPLPTPMPPDGAPA